MIATIKRVQFTSSVTDTRETQILLVARLTPSEISQLAQLGEDRIDVDLDVHDGQPKPPAYRYGSPDNASAAGVRP